MLLPISHERMTVRRVPVVTVAIIVVTLLLHGLASFGSAGREANAMSAMLTARLLYLQRPALGICTPLKPYVGRAAVPDLPPIDLGDRGEKNENEAREIAERYEAACKELGEAVDGLPAQRFGYVPARGNVLGLFTYMFVHADWWHVIGNMWFLFLCGLALEDRWGRLAFAGYYVVAGVVAAGLHHLMTGDPTAALVGASGAVAGAMGAFVVLFATTKIRFVGFIGFRVVSFGAPAYVMLPMWAATEVLYGAIGMSSGTAHWAHVGGFVFGAAVAFGFRLFASTASSTTRSNGPPCSAMIRASMQHARSLRRATPSRPPSSSKGSRRRSPRAPTSGRLCGTQRAPAATPPSPTERPVRWQPSRRRGPGGRAARSRARLLRAAAVPRRRASARAARAAEAAGLMTAAASVRPSATTAQVPPTSAVEATPVIEAAPFFPPPPSPK